MPHKPELSEAAADQAADAVCRLLDRGYLEILADDGTVLCRLELGGPAFAPAMLGEAQMRRVTQGIAAASGKARSFVARRSNDAPVFAGTVGTRDADLILDSTRIEAEGTVTVTQLVYTQERG